MYKTMLSFCSDCRKNKKNVNPKILETSNAKTMILSNCPICGGKKLNFIKKQEENRLSSI